MSPQNSLIPAHPQGEDFSMLVSSTGDSFLPAIAVDTVGRRFQVEWDPQAPATPLGQLVFFCQFPIRMSVLSAPNHFSVK